jgi:hypothetical protein
MADIVLTIDPDDTSFALHDRANGRRLMGFDAPVPETDSQWAFSADTEGERRANLRYRNRVITAQVLLDKSTAALLEALENTLGQKVGKLAREGGELRFTYPTGTTITFNVLEASMQRVFDIADMAKFRARYEISFICEPFGLGSEVDMGDNTETTLPVLIFTETGILGDVPGLGRLVIDNDSTAAQWWMTWGIESRYYSSSANAALFYEAEGRTALGTATSGAVVPTGASGAQGIAYAGLQTNYRAIMSTQATGGGAHLSHVGAFRVYLRCRSPNTNVGTVTVAWEWGEGDFLTYTRQNETQITGSSINQWVLVDMGIVNLRAVSSGTQRWEGRVVVKTSSGSSDEFYIDYLMLVPVSEGSGIASGVQRETTPTAYSAEDHFTSTTSGNALNGRVASPAGGTWATSGVATDFAFYDTDSNGTTNEGIQRSTTAEATPRLAIIGTTNYTDVAISVRAMYSTMGASGSLQHGLIAHWTDSSNYLLARFSRATSGTVKTLEIVQVLAGVSTVFASTTAWPSGVASSQGYWLLYFTVSSQGFAEASVSSLGSLSGSGAPSEGTVMLSVSAQSSTWATGGTLATGEPGIYDMNSASSGRRDYDDFYVWVPPSDAALFGSQSLEVRHDRVVREDSAGAIWSTVSSYEGDYLKVPPAGAEARTLRAIVKATRGAPDQFDNAIDDISARLFVQPRFLVVPDA